MATTPRAAKFLPLVLAFLGVWISNLESPAAPPEIRGPFPRALRPGVASVLSLDGSGLAGTKGLWTSWAGFVERRDSDGWECGDHSARIPVYLPSTVATGIEWIRVLATNGVSGLVWILVDPLRSEAPGTPSVPGLASSPSELAVVPPVAIDGVFAENAVQSVWVRLERGERLSIEVVAQRLGSAVDPILRVVDDDGTELAYVDDSPGLGSDAAIVFVAPATARYRVELRDAEYAGGPASRFRLRLGAFPVGVVASPPVLGMPHPTMSAPTLAWAWESSVSDRRGNSPLACESMSDGLLRLGRYRQGPGLDDAWLGPKVRVNEGPVEVETEPNDEPGQARILPLGGSVTGRFHSGTDSDWYRFSASTSGWIRVSVESRRLGLASDPRIRLADSAGRVLARAESGDPDPVIFHRLDGPGEYRVSVTETGRREGVGRGYWLRIDESVVPCRVTSEVDRLHVAVGEKQVWKLGIDTRGGAFPLLIEAEGLPAGFELENPRIEARKKEWDLTLRCRPEVAPGTVARVRWRFRAAADGFTGTTDVDLEPARKKAFPRMLSVPPGAMDDVWIAAVPAESGKRE